MNICGLVLDDPEVRTHPASADHAIR